ncbi:MAG: hypothetical protein E2P05_09160 [Acidobacteria bacterium]|nr:MAG: hypothetical protein E2P05_09160 [Acidobacteriota bacterium]
MILKSNEKNLLEDLQHDKALQDMARFAGEEGSEFVDAWVSYYACQYTDSIGTTDTRVFEILNAILDDDDFEFEGEEREPYAWENPMNSFEQNKREYQLSYGPETSFEAGEEEL